jgi:hypothetical protein
MLHNRLIELEAEIRAREKCKQGLKQFPVECLSLLEFLSQCFEARLGEEVPKDWRGWLAFKRTEHSLLILRGRAFKHGTFAGKHRAGFDVPQGADAIAEAMRGFDVVPPQDLDHLLVNFGDEDNPKVYLWYGENIAPYRLIFQADVDCDPHTTLEDACIEACVWIANRPRHLSLPDYLELLHDR